MNIPVIHPHDITSFQELSPLQRLIMLVIDASATEAKAEGVEGSIINNIEIADAVGISAGAVSKHISSLRAAGYIENLGVVFQTNVQRRRVLLPQEHVNGREPNRNAIAERTLIYLAYEDIANA